MVLPFGLRRPEVLAPAGDEASLQAAVRAGADAVYFGLQGFNARARATNFDAASLSGTLRWLHGHGARGYVTLNTLVFDAELARLEAAVRTAAAAGVDAVIVQDLGVASLVRAVAPGLPVHASTQMTCTDAASVNLARSLGAHRVILARELSVNDIAAIRAGTDMELEVFVHGALCVAYSGQCLTSEALGGRSANRGACAQACRLPYDLVVDGTRRDLGDKAYLLSPQDLEASASVPQLVALGISSLKIEGRLKGPAYVAATTRLYRAAIDAALTHGALPGVTPALRDAALQMYTRGSGPGFLEGVNHQRLVEGKGCDHRGLQAGTAQGLRTVRGRTLVAVTLERPLARGDGVLVQGGRAGDGEVGGRVWALTVRGADVEHAPAGVEVLVWLGPDRDLRGVQPGRAVWKTSDPTADKAVTTALDREPHRTVVDVTVRGTLGAHPVFEAVTARGVVALVQGDAVIEPATVRPLTHALLRDKLGRLGDSAFVLGDLTVDLPPETLVPVSSLNRARRSLVEGLTEAAHHTWPVTAVTHEHLVASAAPPARTAPAGGLYVLCRTVSQARAALDAGAHGVYLDFLELTGTGTALRALRAERPDAVVGVAPPRIRKPGEEKIDRYLEALAPDMVLVRGLGALHERGTSGAGPSGPVRVGDFSLNVTNRVSAATVLARGLGAFTPSFDLDAVQLAALLDGPFAPWAEVVIHHPMPLFHMEHCVFAALLSQGRDFRDCGRPCDRHVLSLRDRAGMDHPVEADVGCRNTVFHAAPQSAAGLVAGLQRSGVTRFRIELVRESAEEVTRVVTAYRALLAGRESAQQVWRTLKTEGGYGVVKGSLRVMAE